MDLARKTAQVMDPGGWLLGGKQVTQPRRRRIARSPPRPNSAIAPGAGMNCTPLSSIEYVFVPPKFETVQLSRGPGPCSRWPIGPHAPRSDSVATTYRQRKGGRSLPGIDRPE